MKRTLSIIICSGLVVVLSGCSTGVLNKSALPTARPIQNVTGNSSKTQSKSTVATPQVTLVTQASDQMAANDAAALSSTLPTPAAPLSGQAPAKSGQPQKAPDVMGTITVVDGSTLTVQDSRQQSTVAVVVTDETQVFKQATIALTDIAVGESIMAQGTLQESVFTADQIRVGVEAVPANASGGMPQLDGAGQPNGNSPDGGQPPAGGQPPSDGQPPANDQVRPLGQPLAGTVTAIASDGLTIETSSGSTVQVRLASNGTVTRQTSTTSADLVVGVQIMARGEQSDATITATRIDIVPTASQ